MKHFFEQWSSAQKFNNIVSTPVIHYVVLLNKTYCFKVEKDLKFFLKITKKPLVWFIQKFREHGIRVEYGTLFTHKDILHFGPLSKAVSNGIVSWYLQSEYSHSVVFVCTAGFAKQLPFHETINPETLVYRITKSQT